MTTPAKPSKTPITDEIRELRKQIISRFFSSGIIDAVLHENETDQLLADFVAGRENKLRDVIMDCERQFATAQQRIKELEADGRRLDWLEKNGAGPVKNSADLFLQCVHTIADNSQNVSIFTHKTARGVIDAAMSREPKEGEAK